MGRTSPVSLLRAGWSHTSRFLLALPIWVWAGWGCPGGNASPLQLVWIQPHAGPALLTTPSLLALPLCPSSRDLLVQIGAKSPVSLGMGQSQGFFSLARCCFVLWASSPSPSATDAAILPGKHSKIKAARVPRRGRSEKHPPRVQPFPRLPARGWPRRRTDGDPGAVTWGRLCSAGAQCCSSPGRCPAAGHIVFSSGERIII